MPRDPLDSPLGMPPVGLDRLARQALRGWLLLGAGGLAAAGALALVLAAMRAPGMQDIFPDISQALFRRVLVTHVVLAFVLWFLAMLGGITVAARGNGRTGIAGLAIAVLGVVLLVIPMLANRGEPSLNNYVPVLMDPLFFAGLGLFALGVAVPVVDLLMRPHGYNPALMQGAGTAGMLYLLAVLCVFLAWQALPAKAIPANYAEELFWGGGHLLQFAYTTLMLTAWQTLGGQAFGTMPLSRRAWRTVCGLLALAGLPGPILYLVMGGDAQGLRAAFTSLYWIALPVPVTVTVVATLLRMWQGPRDWRSPAFLGVATSLALFLFGGLLGLFADGTDTRTPAHYHAEIAGVNLAFIGLIFAQLLPALTRVAGRGRAVRLQYWLYGGGQAVASLGLFLAGSEGVPRKLAGVAQGLDTIVKQAGMGLAGGGGLVAVIGGVLFIWLTLRRLLEKGVD